MIAKPDAACQAAMVYLLPKLPTVQLTSRNPPQCIRGAVDEH